MSGAALPMFTSAHHFGGVQFTNLFMPLLMFGETLGGDEALSTLLTLIRLIMIYLLMILQVTNSWKTYPTMTALEKAALGMSQQVFL